MKRFFYILALLIVVVPFAQAGIKEGTMTDNSTLLKMNYSESAAHIIDTVRARNNYDNDFVYERVYEAKYPENGKEYTGLYYRKIKAWFDPMADDHLFAEHEINYDNKFFQMEPSFKEYLEAARAHNRGEDL